MKTYSQLSSKAILTYIFSFLLQFLLLSGTNDIIRSFYMFTRLFPNCFYDTMPYRNESEYKKDIKIVCVCIYIYIHCFQSKTLCSIKISLILLVNYFNIETSRDQNHVTDLKQKSTQQHMHIKIDTILRHSMVIWRENISHLADRIRRLSYSVI